MNLSASIVAVHNPPPSMPLFWLSLAFLAGLVLSASCPLSASAWLSGAGVSLALAAAFLWMARPGRQSANRPTIPISLLQAAFSWIRLRPYLALLPALVFLGAARYSSAAPRLTPDHIAWYNDLNTVLNLEGVVIAPPDRRDTSTRLTLEVERIYPGEAAPAPVHGRLLVQVGPHIRYAYGDRLRLQGYVKTPPEWEEFSYRDYLAHQGIYSQMAPTAVEQAGNGAGNPILAAIYRLKERLLLTLYRIYPDPEASLLAGILLGVDTGLPAALVTAYQRTGVSHIIAISGFNMAIVAGLFTTLFARLPALAAGRSTARTRRLGAAAAMLAIAAYTLLVGAGPAVVRAALMSGLSLLAVQLGRRQDDVRNGLNSLLLVAVGMALFNPYLLWNVGFQLSFAATLGLILFGGPLTRSFTQLAAARISPAAAQRLASPVGEYLLFTLAAQLTTLPISLYHFQRLSLVSFLANPLILPAQPAVMILGGLAMLFGMVWLPLGQAAAVLAWPFVAYTNRMVELYMRFPGGSLAMAQISLPAVILYYAGLLALAWAGYSGRLQSLIQRAGASASTPSLARRLSPVLIALLLGTTSVLVWRLALSAPDGRLHLTVLDTNADGDSGEALLIETPSGRFVLVGGGPSSNSLSDSLGRRLPPFSRRLDWLVVAGTQDTQLNALPPVLDRFQVANVLWAGPHGAEQAARALEEFLAQTGLEPVPAKTGQALELGEGACLRVLAVTKRGAVLLLEWKSFHALLPIGADFESLEQLTENQQLHHIEALLLADSGYAPANPPELIERIRPQLALLSVAPGDSQGMPGPETLQALEGYTLLRTDRNGWIEVETDGEKMWVEVERK